MEYARIIGERKVDSMLVWGMELELMLSLDVRMELVLVLE
jgi:hypothetical protein